MEKKNKSINKKNILKDEDEMLEEYDIENLNPRPNPYYQILKKQITININGETIDYFKKEASNVGIPYQTLINLYLTDCAKNKKKIKIKWE